MRHPESYDWPWHPDLQAVFDTLGLTWKVLPPGESLTLEDQGSSPGDACYTGSVFVFEFLCPPEWVVHELAHWLTCRAQRPADLHLKNYGYDAGPLSIEDDGQDELYAGFLTCGLEKFLGLGDYRATADSLLLRRALPVRSLHRPYTIMAEGDPYLCALHERMSEVLAPFLAELVPPSSNSSSPA